MSNTNKLDLLLKRLIDICPDWEDEKWKYIKINNIRIYLKWWLLIITTIICILMIIFLINIYYITISYKLYELANTFYKI